jgi:hypothetical protein
MFLMNASNTGRNRLRILAQIGASLLLAACASAAQSQQAHPALDALFSHVDVGVSAVGEFTPTNTGTNYLGQSVQNNPSTTVGVLASVRYIKSPFVGGEFNYHYARYTENFTYTALNTGGPSAVLLGVQTNATEYTFGYLAHTRGPLFGVQPFAGVGAGVIAFRPTKGGGEGYQPQARAAYYYEVGAEKSLLNTRFGVRVQFRQIFHLAPDFETNYLTTHNRTISTEPTIGFYYHF